MASRLYEILRKDVFSDIETGPWLLASPGHQQPWDWLCRIGSSLSYLRKDFNYLCRDCPRQRYWDILPYFSKKSHCYFEMTNFYHWNLIRICAILELVWNSPIVLQVQAYPCCVISMWRNDMNMIEGKYMFLFPLKNWAHKGLMSCPENQTIWHGQNQTWGWPQVSGHLRTTGTTKQGRHPA